MLDMLESQVITRIKTQFSKKLKDRYPNLKFTNSHRADTVPKISNRIYTRNAGSRKREQICKEIRSTLSGLHFRLK